MAPNARPREEIRVPLNEVAYGTRFVAPDFDVVHFGEYYQLVKDEFLKRQMVPAIARPSAISQGVPTIELSALPRVWFIQASRLIQLQTDRFIYNWRRLDDSEEKYPGFQDLSAEFRKRWSQFLEFSERSFAIPLMLEELSLTYVNQIHEDERTTSPMFAFRNEAFDMPHPELWISQLRFVEADGNMRITVGARPSIHVSTQARITQLDMTVESIAAPSNKVEDVYRWFDEAHALVHRAFKNLVAHEWRALWGFTE